MSVGPLDGLVTGLSTSSVISQLLAVDKIPQQQLQVQQTRLTARTRAWDDIASRLSALRTLSDGLANDRTLRAMSSTSSDTSVVRATSSATATAGSLTLQVSKLAASHQVASSAFASSTALVGAGTVTVAAGAAALGVRNVAAGASLSPGTHALTVEQATSAAALMGSATTVPIVISGANNTVTIVVNGVAHTATLTSGTYSSLAAVAAELTTQLAGAATATADNGALSIATTAEGSAATLGGVSGSAAADLGLAGLATASAAGTDGLVDLDGTQVAVTTTSGTLTVGDSTLTLAGGHLAEGSATVGVVTTTGSTTVAGLASAISALGAGVRASTVQVGSSSTSTKLVLTSSATGVAHALTVDGGGLAGLSSFSTLRAASDSEVTLGSGSGALTVTRSSNTISDLVAGVTLDLAKAAPGTDVTISTDRDSEGITAKAKAMVDSLNGLLGAMRGYMSYDAKTQKAGVLQGDSRARSFVGSVISSFQSTLATGDVRSLSQVGIRTTKDGAFSFDATAFAKALADDPDSTIALLARTATTSDDRVSFVGGSTGSRSGTAAIVQTVAAEQATASGDPITALAAAETLTIALGGKTATYQAAAGASAATVAAGLTTALSSAGIGITASVVGGAVRLTTAAYGSSASFTVASTRASGTGGTGLGGAVAGTPATYSGTDAEALVDGESVVGSGQMLAVTQGTAAGVVLSLSSTAADVAGAGGALSLGDVAFSSGAAGSLSKVLFDAVSESGAVASSRAGADTESQRLQTRIDEWTTRLAAREAAYRRQFAALETLMGNLKAQQSNLASAIAGLG